MKKTNISTSNLEKCIELYREAFKQPPWNENWSYEAAKERLTDLLHTPQMLGFLFEEEGEAVGLAAGNFKRTYAGRTFYLAELCVSVAKSGRGYGSTMLQLLEEEVVKSGGNKIDLHTSANGRAKKFYEKHEYDVKKDRITLTKHLFHF
ncbi:GNAT family N-acetyltransferase [Bacillus sp. JZ8]